MNYLKADKIYSNPKNSKWLSSILKNGVYLYNEKKDCHLCQKHPLVKHSHND